MKIPESVEELLKLREQIEDKIHSIDPKALVIYELQRLTDNKEDVVLYTEDELLDAITVFSISPNLTSKKEAAVEEYPNIFNVKRNFAKEWIVKFFPKK